MALTKAAEQYLAEQPKNVQDVLRPLFEKHPEMQALAEGNLRQSEFDRLSNEQKKIAADAKAEADKLTKWYAENKPIFDSAIERRTELEAQNKELADKIAAAAAAATAAASGGAGGPIDQAALTAAIAAEVQARGYVTQKEMDGIVASKTAEAVKAAREEFWNRSVPEVVQMSADAADITFRHRAQFNEPVDRKALSDFMKERGIASIAKAYDEWVKPRIDKIEQDKQVEARVAAELAKRNLPGVTGSGMSTELGPLQLRIENRDPLAGMDNVEIGSGTAAAKAAAEMRAEGKV